MIKKSDLYWEEIVSINEYQEKDCVYLDGSNVKINTEYNHYYKYDSYKEKAKPFFCNVSFSNFKAINDKPNHPKHNIIDCKSIEDVKYVLGVGGKVVAYIGSFDFNIESVKDNCLVTKDGWSSDKFLLEFDKCKVIGSYWS